MSDLVFVDNNRIVTDSLTIADMFGKRHDNVMADIRTQIEYAGEEFSLLNFQESNYLIRGKQYQKFNLTEEAFALVVFGYNTKEAVQTKIKFIQEFKRMKSELTKLATPSYAIEDPIKRAERWIQEQKEKLMLEQQVKENEAKVTYYDTILQSNQTVTITQIAKDYGLSGMKLNKILHNEGVQYKLQGQWLLYHKHQDKGFTKSKTHMDKNGDPRMHTYWTQKGRLFIHNILSKQGIEPLMDREIKKEA